jgi:hypothetical protein
MVLARSFDAVTSVAGLHRQTCVVVSQVGRRGLVQFALVRHCTQVLVAVSQTAAAAVPTVRVQFASEVHWTQVCVVMSHTGAVSVPHWLLVVHCTHVLVVVSQTFVIPPAPMHWAFVVHERTHVSVAVSQTLVPASPQLAVVRHWTQLPAVEQYGRAPPPQLTFDVQATHLPPLQ